MDVPRIIADNIIKARKESLEAGQQKYAEYFIISGPYFLNYKEEVDSILRKEGYGDVIPVTQ